MSALRRDCDRRTFSHISGYRAATAFVGNSQSISIVVLNFTLSYLRLEGELGVTRYRQFDSAVSNFDIHFW